ncbi:MAG: Serine hydroxymethyltransferase [Candidatus Moranbacteria bacterium GW2011_GWA2_39_41]|nr:MAG: Serine hydroxymethyltransferase [Candidatus Moranbacteria bacterium GW2011_GWA2_39_41]
MKKLQKQDPKIYNAIKNEIKRQEEGLELIPSEIAASIPVMEALGSVLTNKYSEGYPYKRYYGGQENTDIVESIAIERARKLFGVPHVNVQPYSGSPANLAVYVAVCKPGDTVMGLNLLDGGHLTHGWKASATSMFYNTIPYHVKPDGYLDLEEIERLALKHKPKLIWVGATAYAREFPFEKMAKIADKVGAYLAADIAHVAGLVIAGVHKSPAKYAHIITTTTHKTLRGPRGGMIMVTAKGLKKDPELAQKIDRAIFPNLQGGPHNHQTAAIAVALGEAMKPSFKKYGQQVVKNAKALATELMKLGIKLVSNGTDNHLMLIDCGKGRGVLLQDAMGMAGMTVNKNTIPLDPSTPFYPSGVRLGTPSLTVRGIKEREMKKIAGWIAEVMEEIKAFEFPENKEERIEALKKFKAYIGKNKKLKSIKSEIKNMCKKFPLYKDLNW